MSQLPIDGELGLLSPEIGQIISIAEKTWDR